LECGKTSDTLNLPHPLDPLGFVPFPVAEASVPQKKHLKDSKIVSVASDILPMLLGVPRLEGYLDDVFCDAFTPPLLTKTPPYHRGLENDGCSRLLFHFSLVLNLQGEW
jgi:hypothetical protein